MKVKGNGPDIGKLHCFLAYVFYGILVDLIYCHIEADVVGGSMLNVVHYGIVGVAANLIVLFPVSVEAEEDQIRFPQINGECAVCDCIYN